MPTFSGSVGGAYREDVERRRKGRERGTVRTGLLADETGPHNTRERLPEIGCILVAPAPAAKTFSAKDGKKNFPHVRARRGRCADSTDSRDPCECCVPARAARDGPQKPRGTGCPAAGPSYDAGAGPPAPGPGRRVDRKSRLRGRPGHTRVRALDCHVGGPRASSQKTPDWISRTGGCEERKLSAAAWDRR